MFLLAKVLLAGVLLFGVLLVAEEEMMLVVSEPLEKREMIPPESVTLTEEAALLFSNASLVFWYPWSLFSLVGWTGGHRQSYFWSLMMCQYADITTKVL